MTPTELIAHARGIPRDIHDSAIGHEAFEALEKLTDALEALSEKHRLTVETKLFSRRQLEADVNELTRERDEARAQLAGLQAEQVDLVASAYAKGRRHGDDDRTIEHD